MQDNLFNYDVIVVGAGISGIGAGYHLQEKCPGKSFVIWINNFDNSIII